jgi:hypothetical protein
VAKRHARRLSVRATPGTEFARETVDFHDGRSEQMNKGQHSLVAAAALSLGPLAAGFAQAATCMDELERFERRLHSSSLASTDPDAFQALVRQAEETAELRDEEQCLERVAELNAALPEDSGLQPVSRERTDSRSRDAQENPRRPKAPVLMIAGGDGDDEPAKTDGEANENQRD